MTNKDGGVMNFAASATGDGIVVGLQNVSSSSNSEFNNEAGGIVNVTRLASETEGIGVTLFGMLDTSHRAGADFTNEGTVNIAENAEFQLRQRRHGTSDSGRFARFDNREGGVLQIGDVGSTTAAGGLRLVGATYNTETTYGMRFENEGEVNLYGGSYITVTSTAAAPGWTFTNAPTGTITLRDSSSIGADDRYLVFDNDGTFHKTGTGVSVVDSGDDASAAAVNRGTIHVQEGELDFRLSLDNEGTIQGGGTLTTPGLISSNGSIEPGNSVGTLTFNLSDDQGEIDFQAATVFAFELGAPGNNDQIAFTGLRDDGVNVLFNDNTVNIIDIGGLAPGTYTLFTFDQGDAYNGGLTLGSGLEDYAGSGFVYDTNSISLTVIPEPGTGLLWLTGLFVVYLAKRRMA